MVIGDSGRNAVGVMTSKWLLLLLDASRRLEFGRRRRAPGPRGSVVALSRLERRSRPLLRRSAAQSLRFGSGNTIIN